MLKIWRITSPAPPSFVTRLEPRPRRGKGTHRPRYTISLASIGSPMLPLEKLRPWLSGPERRLCHPALRAVENAIAVRKACLYLHICLHRQDDHLEISRPGNRIWAHAKGILSRGSCVGRKWGSRVPRKAARSYCDMQAEWARRLGFRRELDPKPIRRQADLFNECLTPKVKLAALAGNDLVPIAVFGRGRQ